MQHDTRLDAIGAHVERHLGPLTTVLHDRAQTLPVSLLHVAPTVERPFHAFVTAGMSREPMVVPHGAEPFRRAELMLTLPQEWRATPAQLRDGWPLWWLRRLARYPHEQHTWLGWGHTVPNGDPPEPIAPGTRLCCLLLVEPAAPEAFAQLTVGDEPVHFYGVMPVHREELDVALRDGAAALVRQLEGVGCGWQLDRPPVTTRHPRGV